MNIIPVLDLAQGVAVHARGGRRSEYPPVQSRLAPGQPGDAIALIHAFHSELRAAACYVADLDALQGGKPQRGLVTQLARAFGGPLLVDAGLTHPGNEVELTASGIDTVVIGLESLNSFAPLTRALMALGPGRVAFSLDLRAGRPILQPALAAELGGDPNALTIARRVGEIGAERIIVLDLGKVGRELGVDAALAQRIREALPDVELYVGGGVRTWADLEQLADLGIEGVLVATALHEGRLSAREVAALAGRPVPPA